MNDEMKNESYDWACTSKNTAKQDFMQREE
jgi:hypothetical protein